ncbi:MAG: ParB/RepB/Spo0J family partition protein [Syntrophorhabdaceae bacterium]|nr:ParB/RepB/Spo0J family partition protein [Syntrophorhabdaceae bacterium]MDD5245204.1 ParB/RepB/Spo0J family partition protein [Syntrophorhabdaceae bacterium]
MKTIPLNDININDRRFCISYPLEDEILTESIQEIGIVQPVLLLDASPPIIITGFKRIASAKKLGFTKVPAIIKKAGADEAILMSIHDNLGRGLNTVEKACALEKMVSAGFPRQRIFGTMTLLSLEPHEKVLNNFVAIANEGEPLMGFLVRHGVSMKNIEYLLGFDVQERNDIISLVSPLRLTESLLREILEMLILIKIKKGAINFRGLRAAGDGRDLKTRLKKRNYPILSSMEKDLFTVKQRCALPPNIDIKVDPFFEKEYIDILLKIKSENDVKASIEKLRTILEDGYIRSILELTQG